MDALKAWAFLLSVKYLCRKNPSIYHAVDLLQCVLT